MTRLTAPHGFRAWCMLCNAQVFGMSYEEFMQKPAWKRLQMKQAVCLF